MSPMPDRIRIAAVDDHPMLLDGIRRALRRCRDIEIVAHGTSAAEAVEIVREHEPDVVLLDITMPGNGLAAARQIKDQGSSTKIIMLTGTDTEQQVEAALAAGAAGYVLKGAGAKELIDAIRSVASGNPYITPSLASRMLVKRDTGLEERDHNSARLSAREQQILELATLGLSNQEIAERLDLAISTVKNYMSQVFEKMNVPNRATAVVARLRE